jgi:hypothetical protein
VSTFKELKWAKQRLTRGYSDRDWWSIDHFIAGVLSKALRQYVEHGHLLIEDKDEWLKHSDVLADYDRVYGVDEEYIAQLDETLAWVAENFRRFWD